MPAAAEHAVFEQHALDFENVKVIDRARHGYEAESQGSAVHQRGKSLYQQRQRIGTEPNLV